VTVPGEGAHARAVQGLLLSGPDPSALASAGVAWLVVESGTPDDMGAAARTLDRLSPAYHDRELALYRIGGHFAGASSAHLRATIAAHWVWLALLVGCGAGAALRRLRPA
jgi:hypothetical protein